MLLELRTIFIPCGRTLPNVNSVHVEISTRGVFVQVQLQQTIFASKELCLHRTQQVHAFITPPVKKKREKKSHLLYMPHILLYQCLHILFLTNQVNHLMFFFLTDLWPLAKTVLIVANSVSVRPSLLR